MLFSHPVLSRTLNERFECAWESVRPVPKVEIDFGDGRVLERTLAGNVATYVTLADGNVIDIVPGLVDPAEYGRRLEQALWLHERVTLPGRGASAKAWLAAYYGDEEAFDPDGRAARLADLEEAKLHRDLSKALVEQSLKDLLRPLHIERLRKELEPRTKDDGAASLEADTEYNRRVRYPKVRALLAERPLATPAGWTAEIYRDVLDVDLADPYLGLAPYVLGGEGGRH